eukprot:s2898_g7.t1
MLAASDTESCQSGRLAESSGEEPELEIVPRPEILVDIEDEDSPALEQAPQQQTMARPARISPSDMPLQLPEEATVEPEPSGRAAWQLGQNCGDYVAQIGNRCLQPQSQVLVANVVANARAANKATMKQMLSEIRPGETGSQHQSLPFYMASRLLGLGARTVTRIWTQLQSNGWRPEELHGGQSKRAHPSSEVEPEPDDQPPEDNDTAQVAMRHVVARAISCAVEGQSGLAYEREVCRLQLAGVNVGTALHGRRFFQEVIHASSLVLKQLEAFIWDTPLRSTGVASDFALVMDPVSLGTGFTARHDTVLMMNINIVHNGTGCLTTPMIGAPTLGVGEHAGEGLKALCLRTLAEHPGMFDVATLQKCLSLIGGDGGKADTFLDCVDWDQFHRDDLGYTRAIKSSAPAQELYTLAKDLDHLFNFGDGRIIFRSLGKEIDDVPKGYLRQVGGTRKAGSLALVADSIIQHLKRITVGLQMRYRWKQEGHGQYSLTRLSEISRRLLDPAFIGFTMLVADVTRGPVKQHILTIQAALEPWSSKSADLLLVQQLEDILRGYERVEQHIMEIERQYCLLCLRVRSVARAADGQIVKMTIPDDVRASAEKWWRTSSYTVQPVWVLGWLRHLISQVLPSAALRVQWDVIDKVSRFLGNLPQAASSTHSVPVQDIQLVFRHARRKRRKTAETVFNDLRSWNGKVVRIIATTRVVQPDAISRSIDCSSFFAQGSLEVTARASAWHAVRLHHRARVLRGPESSCERLGSIAHQQWDSQQNLAPASIMARVHLMSAGLKCLGTERDCLIVNQVASLMLSAKRSALHARPEVAQIREHRELMAESTSGQDLQLYAAEGYLVPGGLTSVAAIRVETSASLAKSLPSTLPPVLQEALPATVDTATGQTKGLMPSTGLQRLSKKNPANSTLRDAMCSYLETEAGKKWQQERSLVFGD